MSFVNVEFKSSSSIAENNEAFDAFDFDDDDDADHTFADGKTNTNSLPVSLANSIFPSDELDALRKRGKDLGVEDVMNVNLNGTICLLCQAHYAKPGSIIVCLDLAVAYLANMISENV
jgi:hypothetical protein